VTVASTANFVYDADGAQGKTVVNGVTTYYVGNHYIIPLRDEVKNSVVTKYYFAGTTRLAVRTNGTLSFLLGDHIGSSSVTTDANGVKTASALYREASPKRSGGDKAFGETRFREAPCKGSAGNLGTDYKFTGQREEASLGIYFFNARWFDPSLGRFTSPDTIVPTSTQGTQAWDRYAFVNNNPVRYNDPTGHSAWQGDGGGPWFQEAANCGETAWLAIVCVVIIIVVAIFTSGGSSEQNPVLVDPVLGGKKGLDYSLSPTPTTTPAPTTTLGPPNLNPNTSTPLPDGTQACYSGQPNPCQNPNLSTLTPTPTASQCFSETQCSTLTPTNTPTPTGTPTNTSTSTSTPTLTPCPIGLVGCVYPTPPPP
jgi:RHS repeat-associated protein